MTQHDKFRQDMKAAGYEVTDYAGRHCWKGPAVSIFAAIYMQDVIRATDIRLQWDELGDGLIVYPVADEFATCRVTKHDAHLGAAEE